MSNTRHDKNIYPKSTGFLWLIFMVINLFCFSTVVAQDIYSGCVTASDFGQPNQNDFIVRPIGKICFDRCKTQCQIFSKKLSGIEINDDIIERCNVACRSGNIYSSKIRVSLAPNNSGDNYAWGTKPLSTSTNCAVGNNSAIDSAGYNLYNTKTLVKPDDKITIKIMSMGSEGSNAVFMCGSSTLSIKPRFESLNPSDWNNNRNLWSNLGNSDISWWNARNQAFTDTGIDIKDGDFLSITYRGQYRHCPSGDCHQITDFDKSLLIMRPDINNNNGSGLGYPQQGNYYALPSAKLKSLGSVFGGSDKDMGENSEEIYKNNKDIQWLGLQGSMATQKTRFGKGLDFGKDEKFLSNGKGKGNTEVYSQDPIYTFTGALEGFSPRFARLGIAYPELVYWPDNLGGLAVDITRKGCMYTNGQRLQFAIGETDAASDIKNPVYNEPQSNQWVDLTDDNLSNFEYLKIPYEGVLYLRIKPMAYSDDVAPLCSTKNDICRASISNVKELYQPYNTDGQYYVVVQNTDDPGKVEKVVTSIVDVIRTYLFGNNSDQQGMVQVLFNKFISDSGLVKAIRALIVLYMAFTGLCFMIGIAQFTQKEGITRLFKMAIVLTLIGPDSWKFFNDHLFKLFTDGMLELLVMVTAAPDSAPSEIANLLDHPTQIFSVFNEPFEVLFGSVTWIKIIALFFSGSAMGPVIGFVVILAAGMYAICIAKAILLYLVSLIGIGVLLIMAPIFISFMLFEYTKTMSVTWLKQLASLTLQPIFVFSFITVINYLILASLKTALGFSACKACFLAISIPTYDSVCIIPGYITLYGLHHPSEALSPPMLPISAVFYFLILVQAMYVFTEFGASLANFIITQMFAGVNLSQAAQATISESVSMVTTILGVDRQTMEGGQKVRQKLDLTAVRAVKVGKAAVKVKKFIKGN